MDIILLVLHVCLALGMITLILLQRGKGASAGAVLGGGGAGSVFGASGSANFLSKTTALLATAFFINSLVLAYMAANREGPVSVVDSMEQPAAEVIPSTPLITELDETVPLPEDVPVATPVTDAEMDVPPPEIPEAPEVTE